MKVMSAIENCRTAALGGHVARCEDCAHTTIAYNSCRNRHCPKCQGAAAREWMAAREAELLPVPYFHVVFTLPSAIGDIAYQNKAVIYDLLFKASAETMLTIAADPKHLGARIGITSVLHTWGSAMTHHPHVHMIVPGGGLSMDGSRWISCKPNFLLPVRVLSKLFRRSDAGEASGGTRSRQSCSSSAVTRASRRAQGVRRLPGAARKTRWFVYAKRPFAGPKAVLAYLSRYTHRVAISNRRLIAVDQRQRHLQGQGLRIEGPGRYTTMTLDIGEFIRRFLIHVLPKGFHRIRHYGLFASASRAETIARARELLGLANAREPSRRSRSIRSAAQVSPSLARAAAAACSSSRPSRPAANHATGRRTSRRNQDRHLMRRGRHIRTRIAQARFLAGHRPGHGDARPDSARQRVPAAQFNLERASSSVLKQSQADPTSRRNHLTASSRSLAVHRQRRDQIAIARRQQRRASLSRGFLPGGFRTTAPVPAESSRWAVIRNPSHLRTLHRSKTDCHSDKLVALEKKGLGA